MVDFFVFLLYFMYDRTMLNSVLGVQRLMGEKLQKSCYQKGTALVLHSIAHVNQLKIKDSPSS